MSQGARAGAVLVACGALLAACSYSGSRAEQVREWASSNTFRSNEAQVIADAHDLELAMARGTAKQLRTICGGLSSDAGTLYSTLTTPDHVLTDELGDAMEDFFHGAELCAVASSTHSPSARRALLDTRRGLDELEIANERAKTFGVKVAQLP